jgi:hypothetical protein
VFGILKGILQALHAYLELRNIMFYYSIYTKSTEKQRNIIYDIEKLRNDKSEPSTQHADLLQSELIAEKECLKHLSTFYNNADK